MKNARIIPIKEAFQRESASIAVCPEFSKAYPAAQPDVFGSKVIFSFSDAAQEEQYYDSSSAADSNVFILSGFSDGDVINFKVAKNSDSFTLIPCKILSQEQNDTASVTIVSQPGASHDTEAEITDILRKIGVPAHIKGYQYLRQAIFMAVADMSRVNALTKTLYPDIAKSYQTTVPRVERAIRHAIEVVWERGEPDVIQKYFGLSIFGNRKKPTNGEFIAVIADTLSSEIAFSHAEKKYVAKGTGI